MAADPLTRERLLEIHAETRCLTARAHGLFMSGEFDDKICDCGVTVDGWGGFAAHLCDVGDRDGVDALLSALADDAVEWGRANGYFGAVAYAADRLRSLREDQP